MKSYKTICRSVQVEYSDHRSVFYGYAAPADNEEAALAFLAGIRKKHSDATHNVYAYNLRGGISRFSDDGEPHGTSGLPIMEMLRKEEIVDTVIVVSRYFGGTLLGTGGLVRAYSTTAKMAIEEAEVKVTRPFVRFSLSCSYSDFQILTQVFKKYDIKKGTSEYSENVILNASCPETQYRKMCEDVVNATNGRTTPEQHDIIYD